MTLVHFVLRRKGIFGGSVGEYSKIGSCIACSIRNRMRTTCPPLQTCQNGYDRASRPLHTPHPTPPKLSVELACPKVCPHDRIADTLSATGCNVARGRDPAPFLALR